MIAMKVALTLDGKFAAASGNSKWVTGESITKPFWAPNQPDVGRGEQGGFPAYLNLHRAVSRLGFNDSSDTAKPHRHWLNETVGYLVEWSSDNNTLPDPKNQKGRIVNLLPLIDPSKDTVDGTWKKENGVLTVQATNSANIEIPYQAPEEYDFRVTDRESSDRSIP